MPISNISGLERTQRPLDLKFEESIITNLAKLAAITALIAGTFGLLSYCNVPLNTVTISASILGGGVGLLAIATIAYSILLKQGPSKLKDVAFSAAYHIGLTALAVGVIGLWQYSQLSLSDWKVATVTLLAGAALLIGIITITGYILKKRVEAYQEAAKQRRQEEERQSDVLTSETSSEEPKLSSETNQSESDPVQPTTAQPAPVSSSTTDGDVNTNNASSNIVKRVLNTIIGDPVKEGGTGGGTKVHEGDGERLDGPLFD